MTAELPNFTVVTIENARVLAAVIKIEGSWHEVYLASHPFARSDDELWDNEDARVVALPTFNPLNREQAEKMWAMKQRARTCTKGT